MHKLTFRALGALYLLSAGSIRLAVTLHYKIVTA